MAALCQDPRERLASAALTAGVVGALGWALVTGLGVSLPRAAERALETFDVVTPPPPPTPEIVPPPKPSRRAAGKAAPPNIRSKATQVAAPEPIVVTPTPPPPIVVAIVPYVANAPTVGAADRVGPGTGAGGQGDGFGGGGAGDGDGGVVRDEQPPRRIRGRLGNDTLPEYLRERNGLYTVGLRYRVETDGRVTGCRVAQTSGHPALDRNACEGVERKFRYRPALDELGRAVPSTVVIDYDFEIDGE
jgi:protein TonB